MRESHFTGLARRYARALFEVAAGEPRARKPERPGQRQAALAGARKLQGDLRFFAELFRNSPELQALFANPAVSKDAKKGIVEKISQSTHFSREMRNFLFVLVDNRRTGLMDDILESFEGLLNDEMGVVQVDVLSARELSDGQRHLLEDALSRRTGRRVEAHYALDPELIGGIVARVGSTVYDGSVREALRRMQTKLVE
jgi:F-type H+-transporting ATPase subunit delta